MTKIDLWTGNPKTAAALMKELVGRTYQQHPGSPFECGASDSYHRREREPHKFCQGRRGKRYAHLPLRRMTVHSMNAEQIKAYYAGYDYNERIYAKDF